MRRINELFVRLNRVFLRLLFRPRVKIVHSPRLVRLGSTYGGWSFLDDPQLHKCLILSGGLGEDASFDVEFAARYDARVCIVDPTPRAIAHFEVLMERLGNPATVAYRPTGSQPLDAYELSQTSRSQFDLLPKALTDREGRVRLYAPPDPQHVSYSIVDFQNAYSKEGASIEVPSADIVSLVQSLTPPGITLLKLDIEGAEMLVIPHLLASEVELPFQVLIEFDELNFPSKRSKRNFYRIHADLLNAGYVPVFWDNRSCVSYALIHQMTPSSQHA